MNPKPNRIALNPAKHLVRKDQLMKKSDFPKKAHQSNVTAGLTQLPISASLEYPIKQDWCKVQRVRRSTVPYRVNYNWRRGGRLKELRIRHLARKFLYLWVCKTFGRILPSKARSHYCHALLNKTFDGWKEQWWCARVEWKLMVRADCHYRYYIYSQTWKTWQMYILQKKKTNSKYIVAASHANLQLLHKVWIHWCWYIKICKTKHLMQVEARVFHIRTITRYVWSIWTKQLMRKERSRAMDSLAMQHWAETLQHRAWLQWNAMLHQSIKDQRKAAQAQQIHQHRCLHHSFLAWLVYIQVRRVKKHQQTVAKQFYTNNVVSQYFSMWIFAWHHQKSICALEICISKLSRRCMLRRIFQHWSHYIVLRAEKIELCNLADHHYRCYLLRLGFVALNGNVGNKRLKQIQNNLAFQQSIIWVLQKCWNQWKMCLEKQEELELQEQSREAQNHFRKVLLKKSLHYWMTRLQEKKWYQVQGKRAIAHHRRTLLPFFLKKWRLFVSEKKRLYQLKETAGVFHREVVQRSAFYVWWKIMDQIRENRLAERLAVIHSTRHLLLRYWCCWRVKTAVQVEEREKATTADDFFRQQLLLKYIHFWRETVGEQKAGRDKEMEAIRHRYKFSLHRTWSAWQQYVQKKHEKWKKQMCADAHFHRALLCKALNGWKVYHQITHQILYKVDEKEKKWRHNLLRFSFSTWKQNAHGLADEARNTARADQHYCHVLLSKVLGCWRDVISIQVYQRQEKEKFVLKAKKHIDFVHLQHVFSHWKQLSQKTITQQGKLEAASQHYEQQIAKKCLLLWKWYHDKRVRVMLLQRQGEWFQMYRLCRYYFTIWKVKQLDKRREDKQSALALWHWCLVLQGKVFDAWLINMREQQRKRLRIAKAVENYQSHLLRMGVAAVLQYTSDMIQLRRHIAVERQVKTAYSLHQVVYRCAMIWKQRVLCERERLKQTSTAVARKKNVAFKLPVTDVCKVKDVGTKTHILKSASRKMIPKASANPVQSDSFPTVLLGDTDFPSLHFEHQARLQPRKPSFLSKPSPKKKLQDSGNNSINALNLGSSMSSAASLSEEKVEAPAQSRVDETMVYTSLRKLSEDDTVEHFTWQLPLINLQTVQSQMAFPIARSAPQRPTMDNLLEQPVPKEVLLPPSAFLPLCQEKENANEDRNRNSAFGAHQVQKDQKVLTERSLRTKRLLSSDYLRNRTEFLSVTFQDTDADTKCDQQCQLEAELKAIRQQMQGFHDGKLKLRTWQKQTAVLQNWLQVNAAEGGEEVLQMSRELKQLETDIERLSMKLKKDAPHIQRHVARVQEIRQMFRA
ncbi:protein SFI1 homolog isoform X1 [Hemitrygon akajei]|uniref:protein SFI1 homolog isoform X1 n=2 Tax=Hemitrygon akajei TaxID=2704970 RepID=UPI003BF96624